MGRIGNGHSKVLVSTFSSMRARTSGPFLHNLKLSPTIQRHNHRYAPPPSCSMLPVLLHFMVTASESADPGNLERAHFALWWTAYYVPDMLLSILEGGDATPYHTVMTAAAAWVVTPLATPQHTIYHTPRITPP